MSTSAFTPRSEAEREPASTSTSIDLGEIHQRSGLATRVFVIGIVADQWSAPTNCDMDVRALVNHLVSGNLWATELIAGKTIAEVGTRLDGDVLGDNPLAAYDGALSAAQSAFSGPGALERICHLSYGDVPAGVYCSHRSLARDTPRSAALRGAGRT